MSYRSNFSNRLNNDLSDLLEMQNKPYLILITLFLLTACGTQSAPAAPAPTLEPAPASTATPTPAFTPTQTDLFGSVDSTDVQPGLMLEPIVAQIFERELQRHVDVGAIEAFQVESLGVYPKGDGTLYAEVFYRIKAGDPFWPEDGGTLGEADWVTGKCSRFDSDVLCGKALSRYCGRA